MLLAHDGDVGDAARSATTSRAPYRSWHGSPSREDSEIPLIVANRHHAAGEIGHWVDHELGPRPFIQHVTDLILGLRGGALGD